jgi:peptidoglycan/xylan/chitin deacetylase (PgdA/CDA1 family)
LPSSLLSVRSIWLGYHGIPTAATPVDVPRTASMYHVRLDTFRRHLDAIRASGLPILTASESLVADTDHVVLTFDDGWKDSLSTGVECLVGAGMRATFFITRDFVGTRWFADRALLLTAFRSGMELGTHGCSHRFLGMANTRAMQAELSQSKSYLEDLIGAPVLTGSAPGGNWSPALAQVARAIGYSSFATSRAGINHIGDDPFQRCRLVVKSTTSVATIARWLRFSVGPELLRRSAFEVVRRVLGAEGYARARRQLLGTSPSDDVLVIGR